jgi:putative transposase
MDDCSRWRTVDVSARRYAGNTVKLLDRVIKEMPFPIRRIPTNRSTGLFAERVQRLKEEFIKI